MHCHSFKDSGEKESPWEEDSSQARAGRVPVKVRCEGTEISRPLAAGQPGLGIRGAGLASWPLIHLISRQRGTFIVRPLTLHLHITLQHGCKSPNPWTKNIFSIWVNNSFIFRNWDWRRRKLMVILLFLPIIFPFHNFCFMVISYQLCFWRLRLQGRWQSRCILCRGPCQGLQPEPHNKDHWGDRRAVWKG